MEVKKVHWVNPGGTTQTIGIIETTNGSGENKVYAGVGTGLGASEESDIELIKSYGGKIHPHVIRGLFVHLFGMKMGIWQPRKKKIKRNSRVVFAIYDSLHKMCIKIWTATVDPRGLYVDNDTLLKKPVEDVEYTHFMVLPTIVPEAENDRKG